MTARSLRFGLGLLAALALGLSTPALAQPGAGHWAAAWAAAPQGGPLTGPLSEVADQTLRQTVRLTLAGRRLQIRLSNEYGRTPLRIGAASISVGGQIRSLTFAGKASALIPAGAPLISDPVDLAAPRMGEATISLFLPERTRIETVHQLGLHPTLISSTGDFTRQAAFPVAAETGIRPLLTGVSVWSETPTRVIAVIGASIVDGVGSTRGAYADWPDVLAVRLAEQPGTPTGVVNLGIGSNMLVTDGVGVSALGRLDRDVLSQPGLTHIILLEGRNDLSARGTDAEGAYAAYVQAAERAHQHGVKLVAATITADTTPNWDAAKEAERRKLNGLIRSSRAFDGVIDVDPVMQNPAAAGLRPEFDSGDHLHPNDAGYRAMANSIDLGLFDR